MEDFVDLHSLAMVHIETWNATAPAHARDSFELNRSKALDRRRLNLSLVETFKVVNIAELARLRNTLPADKSSVPIEAKAIVYILAIAHK